MTLSNRYPMIVKVVNLPLRVDRRRHIQNQFAGKEEFAMEIIPAVEHKIGRVSLWRTIVQIVQQEMDLGSDFFILCEDDHTFTDSYTKEVLQDCIHRAMVMNADILLGGVSWFRTTVHVSEHLLWIGEFNGLQFTVIFRKFYQKIVDSDFSENDVADVKISSLTDKKFVIQPFVSIQKEFSYSDVTKKNNTPGYVSQLFTETFNALNLLEKVKRYYSPIDSCFFSDIELEELVIPTYVLSQKKGVELEHILQQFDGKSEFELHLIDIWESSSVWKAIMSIVEKASFSEDDVIIFCTEEHSFTEHYHKRYLMQNIVEAFQQGADMLSGGVLDFQYAAPLAPNRCWVDVFPTIQFVVLFRRVFPKILQTCVDDNVYASMLLSEASSNKMVLCPFVSKKVNSQESFDDAEAKLKLHINIDLEYSVCHEEKH